MKDKYNKGFTLIELLVVIAIIGILAGISFFGIQGVFENSRDPQRKSDLKQYQTALESYANKNNGFYKGRPNTERASSILCGDLGLSNCPEDPNYDPITGTPTYNFQTDGTAGVNNATKYVIWAILEDPVSPTTFSVVCSNGAVGTISSRTISGGVCPLTSSNCAGPGEACGPAGGGIDCCSGTCMGDICSAEAGGAETD